MKPWDALCWAVLALGLVIACTKPKPPAEPPTAPRDFGEGSATEYVEALESRGQALEGFAQEPAPAVLYFPLNSTTPRSQAQVTALARHLKRTGQAVRLEGHACPLGSDVYNIALGYHRAMAVRAALVAAGVLGGRIEVTTFGEERPVTTDPAAYEMNRRVEVKPQ